MLAVFLGSLFSMVFLSVPVGFSLLATASVMMIAQDTFSLELISQIFVRGLDNFALLAIPFFMIAGEIMNEGGISKRIVEFSLSLLGHVRGGIGYVSVLASMIFAGVSGSAVADTAAVGSILTPIMREEGYDVPSSVALVCASGCIGPIIPPSILMIIYGTTVEISIIRLFLGGIIPGIIVGLCLMVGWYFHTMKNKDRYKTARRATLKEVLKATFAAIWAIFLPVFILGSIVIGVATPTEAAVVAIFYALFVAFFIYREFDLKKLPQILLAGANSTAIIMIVIGAAMVAAFIIAKAQIPQLLTNLLLSMTNSPVVLMLLINILLLLVGCVMDGGPAILILAPILVPILKDYGIDLTYFGVVMVINLCIGLITPPVGSVMYLGCRLGGIDVTTFTKALLPYLAIMVIALLIVTYFPGLILFIPNLLTA